MENYFIKMYENPKVIEAATERIVDFYVAANDKFFAGLGDRGDTMFLEMIWYPTDLFISPDNFLGLCYPSFKRLIEVGRNTIKRSCSIPVAPSTG